MPNLAEPMPNFRYELLEMMLLHILKQNPPLQAEELIFTILLKVLWLLQNKMTGPEDAVWFASDQVL